MALPPPKFNKWQLVIRTSHPQAGTVLITDIREKSIGTGRYGKFVWECCIEDGRSREWVFEQGLMSREEYLARQLSGGNLVDT